MRGLILKCLTCTVLGGWMGTAAGGDPVEMPNGGSLVIPVADALPVARDDVLRLGEGRGVDQQAAVASLAGGGFIMVYSNLETGEIDSTRLRVALSSDGQTVTRPSPLSFGGRSEDAPAFVTLAGATWLYFASAAGDLQALELERSRIREGTFESAERLPGIAGLDRLGQWPRWVGAEAGVSVTFRGEGAIPIWGVSGDGVHWERTIALGAQGVAYPRVVPLASSGCFYSYQRPPEGGYMATYFKLSEDCVHWPDPTPIAWPAAPNRPDVHDAYALPRLDGGADVYYVYPSLKGENAKIEVGFDLYRRAVAADGTLGVEQLLTDRKVFHPFAPSAHRLEDGRVLVTFSDIDASGPEAVSSAAITMFLVSNDAPMGSSP